MTYENEDLMYAIQDAYEDGYNEIKDYLNKNYRDKKKKHQQNLHELAESVKEDHMVLYHQDFTNGLNNSCIEGSRLLAFSNLIRHFPKASFPSDKIYDDVETARLAGNKAALEAMRKMIEMFNDVAKTEEEKVCVSFLNNVYDEIRKELMGLSFVEWKQENRYGWFLASRKQDEQYFEEYLDYLKEYDYLYDDLNHIERR